MPPLRCALCLLVFWLLVLLNWKSPYENANAFENEGLDSLNPFGHVSALSISQLLVYIFCAPCLSQDGIPRLMIKIVANSPVTICQLAHKMGCCQATPFLAEERAWNPETFCSQSQI